jgi:hypothetical protein
MGWFPIGIVETTKCVGLTAVLFLGPLFEAGIAQGGWRDWIRLRGLDMLSGWIGYRNLVAVSLALARGDPALNRILGPSDRRNSVPICFRTSPSTLADLE